MRKIVFLLVMAVLMSSLPVAFAFEGEERIVVLDNGLSVVLKETHVVPMVSMQAWARAGSIHEGDLMGSGLAHYFEHMLFKGTERRGPGEISQAVHNIGGSDFNAYTSSERTVYHFTILNEHIDEGLDILADMLMNSVFDEEEALKESEVILSEINMSIDRPDSNLYWRMMRTAYQNFPYRHPILGHEELFLKLDREDIFDFYETMYSPSNIVLSLVGSFHMEDMIDKVKHYFGDWERKSVPAISLPPEPRQTASRITEYEADVNVSRIRKAYHIVDMYHPDAYALDCLGFILGSGQASRLHKRLVVQDRIAHSVGAGAWTPQYPGLFMVIASFDTENYTKVRFAIQDEINRFKYEYITPEELERVKNNVLASKIFGDETISSQASSLAWSYFYTGTLKANDVYMQGIESVTPDDIMRVANKYLNVNSMTLVHMKPEKERTRIPRKLETSVRKPDIMVRTLPNGIRVLLVEDHKLPIISASAGFFAGLLVEDDSNSGISELAAKMLKRGTKSYSRQDIIDLETDTGSQVSASSGNNTIFVTAKMLEDHFEKIWPLYVSIMSESCFEDEDFERDKDITLASIRRSREDINAENNRLYRRLAFKGHPYARDMSGTEESVGSLHADDIREFITTHIVPDNMTIALAGAFDSEKMMQRIEEDLGHLEKTGYIKPSPRPVQPIRGVNKVVENMPERRQSTVRMAFRGVDFNNPDKYTFSVISRLMSGLGSRLFENLRSRLSLAYSVYAVPFNGLDTGSFIFFISTMPERRELAIEKMREEIIRLKTEPVPQDELERTINKILGQDAGKLQSTSGLAQGLVLDEMYGIGYEETFEYIDKIRAVTAEDIMRVANKYFDLDNCVIAITEP